MSTIPMNREASSCSCKEEQSCGGSCCCCGMHLAGGLPYKSMATSILLTFFLGPIGLLYSSFWMALILTLVIVPGLFIPAKVAGPIVFVLWLVCSFLGAHFTRRYNKKLLMCSCQDKDSFQKA